MTKIAIRPEIRGFKSYTQAYNVTRNMARGLARHFLLTQDHHGLYHFAKIEQGGERDCILRTLNYLGAVVVAEFNSKGDEVE